MTELQARMNNGQPALNGGQAEEAAVGVAEQTRKAAVGTAEAAPEGERQGPGTIVGLLQKWNGRLVGIPFTLLAGGDKGAVLSGKAWVDDTFELAGALSAAQGQYVDRVLAVQHRVVGQFVDSSWTLATTAWKVARRTPAHDPADG